MEYRDGMENRTKSIPGECRWLTRLCGFIATDMLRGKSNSEKTGICSETNNRFKSGIVQTGIFFIRVTNKGSPTTSTIRIQGFRFFTNKNTYPLRIKLRLTYSYVLTNFTLITPLGYIRHTRRELTH